MNAKWNHLLVLFVFLLSSFSLAVAEEKKESELDVKLRAAVKAEDEKLVEQLLKEEADPNTIINEPRYYRDREEIPVLCEAARKNNIKIVSLLIEHGANVHQRYWIFIMNTPDPYTRTGTALTEAVRYHRWDIVRVLVKHGADVNASKYTDFNGYRPEPYNKRQDTVLDIALQNKAPEEIVEYLRKKGALTSEEILAKAKENHE